MFLKGVRSELFWAESSDVLTWNKNKCKVCSYSPFFFFYSFFILKSYGITWYINVLVPGSSAKAIDSSWHPKGPNPVSIELVGKHTLILQEPEKAEKWLREPYSLELPACLHAKWRLVRSCRVLRSSSWFLHSNFFQTAHTGICDVSFGSMHWAQAGLTHLLAAGAAVSQNQLKGPEGSFTAYFGISVTL